MQNLGPPGAPPPGPMWAPHQPPMEGMAPLPGPGGFPGDFAQGPMDGAAPGLVPGGVPPPPPPQFMVRAGGVFLHPFRKRDDLDAFVAAASGAKRGACPPCRRLEGRGSSPTA